MICFSFQYAVSLLLLFERRHHHKYEEKWRSKNSICRRDISLDVYFWGFKLMVDQSFIGLDPVMYLIILRLTLSLLTINDSCRFCHVSFVYRDFIDGKSFNHITNNDKSH